MTNIIFPHYYGNVVRSLFFTGALIMLFMFPFFTPLINLPLFISMGSIIVILILAGLTAPNLKIIMVANIVASILGIILFEYYAMNNWSEATAGFFWLNHILGIIFFFALYFGVKSLRGFYTK